MSSSIRMPVLLVFVLAVLSAESPAPSIPEPLEFGYPAAGEAWYYIHAQMGSAPPAGEKAGTWAVGRVSVNGQRARDFLVLKNGHPRPAPEVKAGENIELKVRWSWTGKQTYEIRAELHDPKTGEEAALSQKGRAPAKRGYWNPSWKNYLSLLVSEDNGFARANVPVQATFGVLSSYLKSTDELRVVKAEIKDGEAAYLEVPFQVYDVRSWNDPKILSIAEKDAKTGAPITRYHPTTSFGLAFLANLRPREKATYLVFYNNPAARKPSFPTDLRVKGKGLGKTVETSFYKAVLHPKSGTIYEVVEKSTGTRLEHKLETNGSVHWNPDVYSPPHAWYHCSDWENPPSSEDIGPVFYSLRREAPLPFPPGIQVSITYYFYAHSPAILAESVMEIQDDIFVKSLRNAEIVFNKAVFNRAAWRGVDGRLQTLDFDQAPVHPQHAAVLRPDTPWVAFYSDEKGLGFASLFLDLGLPNRHGGAASQQQPYLYLQNGPWYYLSRGFVYSFGSNNQTRMLPVKAGSIYYDRNAWIPFAFRKGQGFAGRLDAAYNALKYPLGLEEVIETYAESPEGWLVPILTEPFEEGVKDALGGVKKK